MKVKTQGKQSKIKAKESDIEKDLIELNYNEDRISEPVQGVVKIKRARSDFSVYIKRVRDQIHPSLGISKNAMMILESFIQDFFTRICQESSQMMKISGHKTLSVADVISAVKILLPKEFLKNAIDEINSALSKYYSINPN